MVPRYAVAVDWSGAASGGKLWIARVDVASERVVDWRRCFTRDEVIDQLREWRKGEPRIVVGFDFAFSAPRWFVHQTTPNASSAFDFWPIVEEQSSGWLACKVPPFWGRAAHPTKWPGIEEEFRATEKSMPRRPASFFQLVGANQVALGSLMGIPYLRKLKDEGWHIWPFDDGSFSSVIEIWPSVLRDYVKLSQNELVASLAFADDIDTTGNQRSRDAYDTLVSAFVMARAFKTGVDLARATDSQTLCEGQIWLPAAVEPQLQRRPDTQSQRRDTDTAKAAVWSAIAGVSNVTAIAFAPSFFPSWYFLLVAAGYGLLLPAIANLHVRHQAVRTSGAVLGTAAGTASVTVGLAASANFDLVVAALFVRGIWWWTIGKMWRETAALPRLFGIATMTLAVLALGAAIASAPMDMQASAIWTAERLILGLWSLALAFFLWLAR